MAQRYYDPALYEEDVSGDGGYRLKDPITLAREADRAKGILPLVDPGISQYNQQGGNFATPADFYKWLYGGGNVVNTAAGQGFQVPNYTGGEFSQYMVNDPTRFTWSDPTPGYKNPIIQAGLATVLGGAAFGGLGAGATAPTGTVGATGSTIGGTEGFVGLGGAGGSGLAGGAPAFSAAAPVVAGTAPLAAAAPVASAPAAGTGSLASFIKDYGPVLGPLIGGGLGILGSNAQADAYSDVANQYLALGAPGRSAFDASFAPNIDPVTIDPALQPAIDTAARAAAASSGARFGDPTGPNALSAIQQHVLGNVILPQVNTARSQFLTRGGMGVNTAGTGSLASAQQAGGPYNAVGYAAGQIFNPPTPLEDLMRQLQGYGIRIA